MTEILNGHGPDTVCVECERLRTALNQVLVELSLAETENRRLLKQLSAAKSTATAKKHKREDYETAERLFVYWQEQCDHPNAKLGPKRKYAILARLEQHTPREIAEGIKGAAVAAYVDEKGARYDDIELICRSEVKLESFIARYHRWKDAQK